MRNTLIRLVPPLILLAYFTPALAQAPPCAVPKGRDRAAIVAAVATGCVQLETGDYFVATPPAPAVGRRPYAVIALGNAELRGVAGTVLHFTGDAGGADWWGLSMAGGSVHDLTIETGTLTGTSEQTHAIRINGPAVWPTVYNVTFEHPQRGLPGGDCIQIVGYAATPVSRARIHHNAFAHCDRSGVGIHSGAIDLEIADNTFWDVGDQDIDGEGSGASDGWLIARNVHHLGTAPQGDLAIQIQATSNVRITESTLLARGIDLYGCTRCEIDHSTIKLTTSASGVPVIAVGKDSMDVNIHHMTIERTATARPGAVVRGSPHGSGQPSGIRIADSTLIQTTSVTPIDMTGIVGLEVSRNLIVYTGSPFTLDARGQPAKGFVGVAARGSTPVRTTLITLDGNTFMGPLLACLGLSGSYAGTGSAVLRNNIALGPAQGLRCEGVTTGAAILGPIWTAGNLWPEPVCGSLPVSAERSASARRPSSL